MGGATLQHPKCGSVRTVLFVQFININYLCTVLMGTSHKESKHL